MATITDPDAPEVALPEATATEPVSLLEAVLTETDPLELRAILVPLLRFTEPPTPPVELPPITDTSPPAAVPAVLAPPEMVTSPPAPSVPTETPPLTEIAPPFAEPALSPAEIEI